MTEQDFLAQVATNFWWLITGKKTVRAVCPFCNSSIESTVNGEVDAQKIDHKTTCPVLYAREKLADLESK